MGEIGVGGLRAYEVGGVGVMGGGEGTGLVLSDPEHVYAAMDKIMHKHLETLYWRVGRVLTRWSTLCYASREAGG